ncbi:DUF559 domain-containing protein [Antrihabitans sp. YC2-6]|uniref:DUF559 domain-containing protein n=1 Tax=Antrihabitans sp. YC2-6 TaxID=2799498 RepID=UPI0018F31D11|nr:DUF559 domain-containing protein [Antrihabitans sp. YC2-6]MBJ8343350.1 DUF559 domain-containing protein [Antrihabitans sp. YC2-6]
MGVRGPISGIDAVSAGLVTRWQLRTNFVRIHPDVFVHKDVELNAQTRAFAAACWAKGEATLVGHSAAALHGTKWLDPQLPAEVVLAGHTRPPKGIVVYRDVLSTNEQRIVAGIRATTPARTAFDLGRRLPRDEAVIVIDALCNATDLKPEQVLDLALRYPGSRGIVGLRRVLDLVDGGAESPPETRTRLLLIDDGLPRPDTQVKVRAPDGTLVARSDLGWPKWKILVEYDGEHHWNDRMQRSNDIDRLARLEALGWRVVRVSAELLQDRPYVVIERVRAALRAAGAPI